jgi:hypothetical protein
MFSAQGVVQQVSEKPFTDKWGKNITLFSFQLQGNQQWFRTGTNRPPCQQGENISFVYEQQGNNAKVDPQSIQGGSAGAPPQVPQQYGSAPQAAPQAQPAPVAPAATRDTYWKDKEDYDKKVTQPRIAYAAAQKSAVSIVTAALANDILGFGSAKKGDKLDMLIEYVEEVTGRLALKLDDAHNVLANLKKAPVLVNEDDMYDE